MLEFIVLGNVPGTQIQLSFNDSLLVSAWVLVLLEAFIILQRHRRNVRVAKGASSTTKLSAVKSKSKTKKHAQKSKKTTIKMVPKTAAS